MPENPYDEDVLKRQAQIGMLGGERQPTSTTLPVAPAGRPSWHVDPTGDMGSLQGFDARNMSDPAMQSVKYRHGRLARGVTKPSEMGALVQSQAYQSAFPGATFDGKDRVNFMGALADGDHGPAVNVIDVLRAADKNTDTSEGGWWGPLEEEVAAIEAGAPKQAGLNPAGDNSALAKIMAELQATQNDEMSPAEREAMLAMLQGGI
jgi:hypothetical protein